MSLEQRLRDDGAHDHPNPLAGRAADLVGRTRRRRQRRQAGVVGVGAAAVVAVALLVPGPWRDAPLVADPTTPPTSPVDGAPVEVCDVTIDVLRPDPASDVGAALAVDGDVATLTLTSTADVDRTIREVGNEVFLVDTESGEIVAHQADLTIPLGITLPAGAEIELFESLALTPCAGEPVSGSGYALYARGSVTDVSSWFAGPAEVTVDAGWFAVNPEDAPTGAVQPELCEVPLSELSPQLTPGPAREVSDVRVVTVRPAATGGSEVSIRLVNRSDAPRQVESQAELFLVDPVSGAIVGYAATDDAPTSLTLEPGDLTELVQVFDPRSCDGGALPDGWYVLYARGSVEESIPWVANPSVLGWSGGTWGSPQVALPPAAEPDRGVPFTAGGDFGPWPPPDTAATGLAVSGAMPTEALSGRWDGADTIQTTVQVTNTGSEDFEARVYAWVILVLTLDDAEETPVSIAAEPYWSLPQQIDLAPGESQEISVRHWLGSATGFEHTTWTEPVTDPGTYDAYIVLTDAASYDPGTMTGFAYAVGGPYDLTVE